MIFSIRPMSIRMAHYRSEKSKTILVDSFVGLGLLFGFIGVAGAASPQPEQFVPPQQTIAMPLETKQVFAVDVNADGCADLVSLVWQTGFVWIPSNSPGKFPVIEIRMNKCADKKAAEPLEFYPPDVVTTITSASLTEILRANGIGNADRNSWLNETRMATLTVVDVDDDGLLDLVMTSASTSEIFLLWNQGKVPAGGHHYVFDPSNSAKTTVLEGSTIFPQSTYMRSSTKGIPLYTEVADINADGKKDLITYWANYTKEIPGIPPVVGSPAPGVPDVPAQQYEAIGVVLGQPAPGPHHIGFNAVQNRLSATEIQIGNNPTKDLFRKDTRLFDYLPTGNFALGEPFFDRMTDEVGAYQLPMVQQASPLIVDPASEADGSDSIWLSGKDGAYKLVWNATHKLMVQKNPLTTTIDYSRAGAGKQRGGAIALVPSATPGGKSSLMTAGGTQIYYPPISRTDDRANSKGSLPSYYTSDWKLGAWLAFQQMGTGPALLTLADYLRPGEGTGIEHNVGPPFDYMTFNNGGHWGYAAGLVIEYAEADGSQYKPFLQGADRSRIQMLPTMSSMLHHPQIGVASFGLKDERAIFALEDGSLNIFRPNTDKSYNAPNLAVDGIIPDSLKWLGEGEVLKKVAPGTDIMVVGDLGSDAHGAPSNPVSDPPRYTIVKKKSDGSIIRVLPIAQVIKSPSGQKYIAHLERIKDLPLDTYTFEFWNSAKSASIDIPVEKSFSIASSNLDWRMSDACGIQKSTLSGLMYPSELRLTVADLPTGALDKVRFQRLSDGKLWEVAAGASGATIAGSEVVLAIPSDIESGSYRIAIKANGYWQEHARRMTVNREGTGCDQVMNLRDPADPNKRLNWINHTSMAQNDDTTLYLQKIDNVAAPWDASGKTAMTVEAGDFTFIGSGFATWQVQSALLKQGTTEIWYDLVIDPKNPNDNWLYVKWGDLSGLTDGQPVDVYFYPETHANVVAKGAPPVGKITNWRTAKKGTWKDPPDSTLNITSSQSEGGAQIVEEDATLKLAGSGLVFPGPNNMRPAFNQSGDVYLYPFGAARVTEKWFTEKQSNAKAELEMQIGPDPSQFLLPKAATPIGAPPIIETIVPAAFEVVATEIAKRLAPELISIPLPAATAGLSAGAVVGLHIIGGVLLAKTLVVNEHIDTTALVARHGLAKKSATPKPKEDTPEEFKDLYVITYAVNGQPGPLPSDNPDLDDGREYSYDRAIHFVAVCVTDRKELLTIGRKAMALAIQGNQSQVAISPRDYNVESGKIRAVMLDDHRYTTDGACRSGQGATALGFYSKWKVRGRSLFFPFHWDQTVFEGSGAIGGGSGAYNTWSVVWRLKMAGMLKLWDEHSLYFEQLLQPTGAFVRLLGKESDFTWVQPGTSVP